STQTYSTTLPINHRLQINRWARYRCRSGSRWMEERQKCLISRLKRRRYYYSGFSSCIFGSTFACLLDNICLTLVTPSTPASEEISQLTIIVNIRNSLQPCTVFP